MFIGLLIGSLTIVQLVMGQNAPAPSNYAPQESLIKGDPRLQSMERKQPLTLLGTQGQVYAQSGSLPQAIRTHHNGGGGSQKLNF